MMPFPRRALDVFRLETGELCAGVHELLDVVLPLECQLVTEEDFSRKLRIGDASGQELWTGVLHNRLDVIIKCGKTDQVMSHTTSEAVMMRKMKHESIVQVLAVCLTSEMCFLIMELFDENAKLLKNYLRDSEPDTSKRLHIAAQVAGAMDYLERHNYVHRDLSSRSVLVGDNNTAKIFDFGMAQHIPEGVHIVQDGEKFPIKWWAPEAIFQQTFTIKSDVWSYGILLVEIWTLGQIPYPGVLNMELCNRLKAGYRHPKPEGTPQALYDIMKRCWDQDPQERYSFEYLHSLLSDPSVFTI